MEYANDIDKLEEIVSNAQSYTEAHTVLDMWCKSLLSFFNKIDNVLNYTTHIDLNIHQIYMSNSYALQHLPSLKMGLELMSREELHFKNENQIMQNNQRTPFESYEQHFGRHLEKKGIMIGNIGRDVYINSSIDSITNVSEFVSSCIDKVNKNEKMSKEDKTKVTTSLRTLNTVYDNIKLIGEFARSLLSI
jgi:hypothetical protein